ncbi:MAG: NAD(P)/FAD-dependent oxidoreductase [Acidobacteria bacterium]|nr:NAD(P)/FAD-dependent oxidoreductase [Acidobacteriota bacterium]
MAHVVIIGGGFGGLAAARALGRTRLDVTLLDRRNHHVFQPLLYQVATAGLSPGDIASPIRWVLRRQRNVNVLLADVVGVDPARACVRLADGGARDYDFLIVATGATHAYFGHDEWQRRAPGLKTLEDGLEIRRRVLLAFERAELEPDARARARWLTFVVIGGGPTGVEMAGALAELARHMRRDFRSVDPRQARIILLEGGPTVLPSFDARLRGFGTRALARLGVDVRTRALVTGIDEGGVAIGRERIEAATVLWAAGVSASPLGAALGAPVDRAGRVAVNADLTVPSHPEIYVVGDLAAFTHTPDGKPLPGVAPVAMQQAQHAVKNILRTLRGEARQPFAYHDPGSLATIGRAAAVADFGRLKFTGHVAWLLWLFVHIMKLTGFRNRVVVFFQWAWAYFTQQRAVRLITHERPEGAVPR